MRHHEARLLADSLRTSRLTLLYAAAGASRAELLAEGVMALLARRETDVLDGPGFAESRVVVPFVDRRGDGSVASGNSVSIERAVYFSAWKGGALTELCARIRGLLGSPPPAADASTSLVDALSPVSERSGARVLIVLDAVESLWSGSADALLVDHFIVELTNAVNRADLHAHFLLAIDDRWEGRMDVLRSRIPGFDDSTVRLLGLDHSSALLSDPAPSSPRSAAPLAVSVNAADSRTLPVLSTVAMPPSPPPDRPKRKRLAKVPRAPEPKIGADSVYALIESTLTQTADASEPWHEPAPLPPELPGCGARLPVAVRESAQQSVSASLRSAAAMAAAEPPSPIDEWIDRAVAWCRRLLRSP